MFVFIDLLSKSELGVSSFYVSEQQETGKDYLLGDYYLVRVDTVSWEGYDDSAELFANVAQDLSPLVCKVLVMLRVHSHSFFSYIVLRANKNHGLRPIM